MASANSRCFSSHIDNYAEIDGILHNLALTLLKVYVIRFHPNLCSNIYHLILCFT
jgi:hypothetical protein